LSRPGFAGLNRRAASNIQADFRGRRPRSTSVRKHRLRRRDFVGPRFENRLRRATRFKRFHPVASGRRSTSLRTQCDDPTRELSLSRRGTIRGTFSYGRDDHAGWYLVRTSKPGGDELQIVQLRKPGGQTSGGGGGFQGGRTRPKKKKREKAEKVKNWDGASGSDVAVKEGGRRKKVRPDF